MLELLEATEAADLLGRLERGLAPASEARAAAASAAGRLALRTQNLRRHLKDHEDKIECEKCLNVLHKSWSVPVA